MKALRVLFIASELNPLAKVGGLADVIGALPKALKKQGVDVRIMIPKYSMIDPKQYPMQRIARRIPVRLYNRTYLVNVFTTKLPGTSITVYLIDQKDFFADGGVYYSKTALVGTFKEIERFLFFGRAALESLPHLGWKPDILHCNDWHTAFIPVWLKTIYCCHHPFYASLRTLYTIHNLANQGIGDLKLLKVANVSTRALPSLERDARNNDIDLMVQGILTSDAINTVSPTYVKEILTPEYGERLDPVLKLRQRDLYGILNGIDTDVFNPSTDVHIRQRYSVKSFEQKQINKAALQQMCGFHVDPRVPVFGMVSRLTHQKGFDLLIKLRKELIKLPMQLVILGTGDATIEKALVALSKRSSRTMCIFLKFDAKLAQMIYAGSDFFLMPSRFEPCGLGQMIAMRYGTPPVVRSTGGLADTVRHLKTGVVFHDYAAKALLAALHTAIRIYHNPHVYTALAKAGMRQDLSWGSSAQVYMRLYRKLLASHS